ncbi:class I SAM-dependent methyltransferase [Puia sp. P3]|uniref:class I SAM-dependent methyltransferase n=1 Tax=Puia sp. P3 TaxID=3423952 RepID=UPI003D670E61
MDSTERFSDRVEDYVRYRPTYPVAILSILQVGTDRIVADIGSGTGISTELFLRNNNRVYAVEPNAAMRKKRKSCSVSTPDLFPSMGRRRRRGFPIPPST